MAMQRVIATTSRQLYVVDAALAGAGPSSRRLPSLATSTAIRQCRACKAAQYRALSTTPAIPRTGKSFGSARTDDDDPVHFFPKRKHQDQRRPKYDFTIPAPKSIDSTKDDLRLAVRKTLDDDGLVERIVGWGISGPDLLAIYQHVEPGTGIKDVVDVPIMRRLLRSWSLHALAELDGEPLGDQQLAEGGTLPRPLWDLENIRQGLEAEGEASLDRAVIASFLDWLEAKVVEKQDLPYLQSHLARLRKASDMCYPSFDSVAARSYKRNIHLHVGPTNSGKTHGALVALCKANTGLYAGPLRLLAHEVWDRINHGQVSPDVGPRPCNLVTGEEVKTMGDKVGLMACTVEMSPLDGSMDVAVIDEIQMLGDPQRGWSWTAAVVGIPAKELHLCGEASVIPLIKKIAEACGDVVHIHEYQRLTPLELGDDLGGQIKEVKKGDCIVAFSRSDIFKLKAQVEEETGLKCALAYGALPPETKAEQAKIFNDPDNDVDVMIASDAIGMGLNLKIKRVIFQSVTKWNGRENVVISSSQLKQIAGRAGRYGTNTSGSDAGGFATTLSGKDIDVLKEALKVPLLPITRAAMQPSSTMLSRLSTLLPPLKMSNDLIAKPEVRQRPLAMLFEDASLLMRLNSSMFFSSPMEQQRKLGPVIEAAIPSSVNLTISERERFANAPANTRDDLVLALFSNMVRWYARGTLVSFEDVERGTGLLDALHTVERVTRRSHKQQNSQDNVDGEADQPTAAAIARELDVNVLMTLESLHRGLTLYMWLSNRFRLAFCYVQSVESYKTRTEKAIEACLAAIREGRKERLMQMGRVEQKADQWFEDGSNRKRFVAQAKQRNVTRFHDRGEPLHNLKKRYDQTKKRDERRDDRRGDRRDDRRPKQRGQMFGEDRGSRFSGSRFDA